MSIGGSGGLFVGASLLTFVELLYYFTLRPCANDQKRKREENEQKKVDNAKVEERK